MYKPIKELDIYISDGNYSSKYPCSEEFVSEGIPFIRGNNMLDGEIIDEDMYFITSEKHSILLKGHVKAGDVLITTRGNIGQVAIVPEKHEDSNINAQIVLLRVNSNSLYNRYLLWALQSKKTKEQFESLQTGTALKQLPVGKLEQVKIKHIDLEEQHYIVNILDRTYQIIKQRRWELQELDSLIKSRFVEMFGDPVLNPYGWEQTTLKDVAVGNLSYGSCASAVEFDGTCRYVRITDITESGGLNDDVKSPDKYDEKYLLHDGDVLFARSGATVGKTLRYSEEKHGKGIYAGYLIRLVPNTEKVLPDYVFYYTKTEYYASFVKKAQRAVAQPNINAQEYGDLIICVPPIELQEKFMAFVTQVDKLKFEVQRSLDETQMLMDSLMQKYFG